MRVPAPFLTLILVSSIGCGDEIVVGEGAGSPNPSDDAASRDPSKNGADDAATTTTPASGVQLQFCGPPLGDEPVSLIQHDSAPLPTGTFIAQDKSKGVTWLIQLAQRKVRAVALPYNNGNHETAVTGDGSVLVSPHYETLGPGDDEGKGFYPGAEVSMVELDSGQTSVAVVPWDSPLGRPKPHGAHWMANGDLLITAQVANSLIRFTTPLRPGGGALRVYDLEDSVCRTPHLVNHIPESNLAVSGCRCDNPGDPKGCGGQLAVVDLESGRTRVLPAGQGAEGLTVTAAGEVWVGARLGNVVNIYGFSEPDRGRGLEQLEALTTLDVPAPLRLAYEPMTDAVGIVTFDPNGNDDTNFRTFDAKTHRRRNETTLKSAQRGRINSEGLAAANGVFITGGFDNQTLVIVDPVGLEVRAEVLLPRCSLPDGFDTPTPMTADAAKIEGQAGSNNWSGGVCPGAPRSPDDRRFAVLDGFSWSPLEPRWSSTAQP